MTERLRNWLEGGEFFLYRDHQVFWRQAGEGCPLLLLHGFPTASFDWHYVWPVLEAHFRVLSLDFLGYGFSDKPADYTYTVFDHADLVESLLARVGVARFGVLAHDYGDTVAQELIARHDEDADRPSLRFVCLLNGGIFPGVHRPTWILKLLRSPLGGLCSTLMTERIFRGRMGEIFGADSQPTDPDLRDWWELVNHNGGRRIYHKLIRYMDQRWTHRERWVGALRHTRLPMRLINGAADPISGKHLADYYLECIPHPDVISLEDIGHYPQVEAPGQVVEALLKMPAIAKLRELK